MQRKQLRPRSIRFLILDSGPETYDPGPIFTLRSLRIGVRKGFVGVFFILRLKTRDS